MVDSLIENSTKEILSGKDRPEREMYNLNSLEVSQRYGPAR
jgi:hypothetical protein